MNKKGFSLVELLVVIALLAVVLGIAIPRVSNINNSAGKRNFETKKRLIISAAEMYVQDKHNSLTLSSGAYNVTINALLENGYIEPDLAKGEGSCSTSYNYGCVVNTTNGTILNNNTIKVEVKNKRYIGSWVN